MALEQLVTDFGAVGLFLGAGFEGEGVAMMGGVLSHRGLLHFWLAILSVASGSFLIDQLFFLLGRRYRGHPRVRSVQASSAGAKVLRTFERRPDLFVFAFRFLYGLRIASAITIGTTTYPWGRLILLNALAALIWASLFVTIGYLCGQAIEGMFGHLHAALHYLIAGTGIIFIVVLITVVTRRTRRRATPDVSKVDT
ncbi:DedA family protein [Falsirhodobacter sp. 20TX0035]|uniref:DedA family protein n=1 Tax=Falsirhodobacter sp. 20TX0035 TaxID=3022019 RepID=UPI00232CF117|nr:VTT domain-containing protein [Falsirhodobacter sp. 20TX0035]MDB6455019.1 VTT domain-containing protein [Falsirhodobacter sp. 20TX0035]